MIRSFGDHDTERFLRANGFVPFKALRIRRRAD